MTDEFKAVGELNNLAQEVNERLPVGEARTWLAAEVIRIKNSLYAVLSSPYGGREPLAVVEAHLYPPDLERYLEKLGEQHAPPLYLWGWAGDGLTPVRVIILPAAEEGRDDEG